MMKSVALTESAVQRSDDSHSASAADAEYDAEDFILVSSSPNAEPATWEVSFEDDASYDRCDDVCSIYSAPQSLAIESNALDSFQKDFFSRGGRADATNKAAPEDFLLHDFSAMALSSGGIIDLPDEDLHDLIASFSVDDDGDDVDGRLPPPFETSDSSVSGASNVHESDDDEDIAKLHPVAWVKAPMVTTLASTPSDKDSNPASTDDDGDDDLESMLDEAMSRKVSTKPTRLCKKKRRKQLKLAKKAAAAAAAAAALTHFGSMVGTTPVSSRGGASGKHPSGGKLNKRHASRSRKQIANIAVACATESYASYREECLRKSKK